MGQLFYWGLWFKNWPKTSKSKIKHHNHGFSGPIDRYVIVSWSSIQFFIEISQKCLATTQERMPKYRHACSALSRPRHDASGWCRRSRACKPILANSLAKWMKKNAIWLAYTLLIFLISGQKSENGQNWQTLYLLFCFNELC